MSGAAVRPRGVQTFVTRSLAVPWAPPITAHTCPSAAVATAPALSGQDGPGFLQGPQKAASFGYKEPRPQRRLAIELSLPAPRAAPRPVSSLPAGRNESASDTLIRSFRGALLSHGSVFTDHQLQGGRRAGELVARPPRPEATGLRKDNNMSQHSPKLNLHTLAGPGRGRGWARRLGQESSADLFSSRHHRTARVWGRPEAGPGLPRARGNTELVGSSGECLWAWGTRAAPGGLRARGRDAHPERQRSGREVL